jgi:hypothetical protein
MIEKPVDELGVRRKAVRRVRLMNLMAAAGIAALLLFIGETVAIAQEPPTASQGSAPVPFDPSEAGGPRSDRASIDRSRAGGINDPAAATQIGQASPGQWLIDDVARERAKFEVKRASPSPIPPTTTASDPAPVEAGVGLRSPEDTRAGGRERGPDEVTGSIGRPPALSVGDSPSSESRAGSVATEAEDGRPDVPPSHRSLERSDEHSASTRPNASRGLVDATMNCVETPVGQAPEGEHWYYRLERETHRKCWYVRAHRRDERSFVESGRRLSERSSADPLDAAWAWWYWQ